jgi:hypothetical protein
VVHLIQCTFPPCAMHTCPCCVCAGVLWSDMRALSCAFCGDNIRSEPRDLDEDPRAANGSLVRATPTSCCECCSAPAAASCCMPGMGLSQGPRAARG